jgi:hypothetical protein
MGSGCERKLLYAEGRRSYEEASGRVSEAEGDEIERVEETRQSGAWTGEGGGVNPKQKPTEETRMTNVINFQTPPTDTDDEWFNAAWDLLTGNCWQDEDGNDVEPSNEAKAKIGKLHDALKLAVERSCSGEVYDGFKNVLSRANKWSRVYWRFLDYEINVKQLADGLDIPLAILEEALQVCIDGRNEVDFDF